MNAPRTEQEEETRVEIIYTYMLADLLRQQGPQLEAMLAAMNRAETVAPLFNPTLWLEKGDAMREDKSVVAILVDAVRALNKLPRPERAR